MVSVAKREESERPSLKAINLSMFESDLELAQVVAEHRERRTGNRVARSDILREAMRRGLMEIADEEGVKPKR